jgi:hypothetical protein
MRPPPTAKLGLLIGLIGAFTAGLIALSRFEREGG